MKKLLLLSKKRNVYLFKFLGLLAIIFLMGFAGIQVHAQTTLYFKGTGALNDVNSWGINIDGTGGNAGITDFTGVSFSYIIQNTPTIVFNSGIWTVSGAGTKVYLGNPLTPSGPVALTIAPGATINTAGQLFDVAIPTSGNHKIIYQNTAPISVGTISDANLELVFDGAMFATATSRIYGNASLINGASIDFSGASNGPTFNNLTIEEGCTLTGPVGSSSTWIGIKAGGIVTINGTFKAGRTGGLFSANVPFPVVNSTANGVLLFNSPTVTQGVNLILGNASTVEYYRGITGQTGAQTVQALNYANLILSNSVLASNKTYATGNFSVSKTFTVNLIGAATITPPTTQNITLLPGARLLVSSATAFPVPTGSGRFTLQSGLAGTASIGTLATGASITGNVTVQQYVPPGFRKYRFLSHPFTTAQPLSQLTTEIDITGNTAGTSGLPAQTAGAGFTSTETNNPSAYFFSTADANGDVANDGGWKAFTDATTSSWSSGRGIRVLVRGAKGQTNTLNSTEATPEAVTLDMTGIVNTGNVSIPLVTGGSGATAAFNMVGNPYASPVDIGAVLTAAGGNVGNAFYLRNPQTGSYVTVSPIPASYIIPAYTAFFIKANAAANLNFTESVKNNCTACVSVFSANKDENGFGLQILENGLEYDKLVIKMDKNFSNNLDEHDAEKLMNDGLSIYALSADKRKLAVASFNKDIKNIPLGIALPKASGIHTYSIKVNHYTMDKNLEIWLHDYSNNTFTLLKSNASITLTVDPSNTAQVGEKRLQIIVRKKGN